MKKRANKKAHKRTIGGQTEGKQRATNKNDKNEKNDKKKRINKKENSKKEKTFQDVFNENNFSDKLIYSLNDFIRMRKTIKRPMTTRALELLLNELNKLTNLEEEKVAIINQSIVNSWQTVYPLKNQEEKLKFNKIKSSKEKEEQIEFSADILTNEEYGRLLNGKLPREELKQIVLERTGG